MSEKYIVRVLTLGYTDVGKTSILLRFTKNQFHDKYVSTIGIDFKSKPLKINDNTTVKVLVWDTAGEEKYKGIVKSFYNKANGILLTFDLTNKESFDRIDFWVQELKNNVGLNDLYIVLVGNKKDKIEDRKVSYEEAEKYSLDNDFRGYFEVSAKTNEGIN
jgi:small GTP-binding protein